MLCSNARASSFIRGHSNPQDAQGISLSFELFPSTLSGAGNAGTICHKECEEQQARNKIPTEHPRFLRCRHTHGGMANTQQLLPASLLCEKFVLAKKRGIPIKKFKGNNAYSPHAYSYSNNQLWQIEPSFNMPKHEQHHQPMARGEADENGGTADRV